MTILNAVLSLLAIPLVAAALYLSILAVASMGGKLLPFTPPRLRFTFLVPAHNEEQGLQRTLDSLSRVEWPRNLFRVHVVADNCTDATAQVAEKSGVEVTVRKDEDHRGKGYALRAGVDACLAQHFPDAVLVIDADTIVEPNILAAMQAHLDDGAQVVQARYGVLDAESGWRARLMELALALFHDVRSRGRQNLGLSSGLRGNGMCFTRNILLQVPLQSTSLVEDVEQGIILGCAGIVVHHARETRVLGEMPRGSTASTTQRIRWERGRSLLTRTWLSRLCKEAWRERDPVLADLAADLAVPPLTTLALIIGGGWVAAALLVVLGGGYGAFLLWSVAAAMLMFYVARGVAVSQRGWRALGDLAAAPFFVGWKVLLRMRNRALAAPSWVRTTRLGEKP